MACKLVQSFSATEDIIIITATAGDIIITITVITTAVAAGILAGMMAEDIQAEDILVEDMTGAAAAGEGAVATAAAVAVVNSDLVHYRRHAPLLYHNDVTFKQVERTSVKSSGAIPLTPLMGPWILEASLSHSSRIRAYSAGDVLISIAVACGI